MHDDSDSGDAPASDEQVRAERLAIRRRAMDLLARREHAPVELAAKLRKRAHAEDDIAIVVEALIAENLLSASRYTHAVVASKATRGIGPLRIRNELAAVGIDAALIDAAFAATEIDWTARAETVRIKRFGAALPEDFPAKAKQMRFLQRRGFSSDEIAAAVDSERS